jgi:spore coat polysaccharide biosynthesis protein SpsF (cytidylyltransferase family)
MQDSEDLEHVTKYFYKHQDDFNLFNFEANQNYGQVQLSVDTPQDMTIFASIVSTMIKPHWQYTLTDILNFYWDAVGNS